MASDRMVVSVALDLCGQLLVAFVVTALARGAGYGSLAAGGLTFVALVGIGLIAHAKAIAQK